MSANGRPRDLRVCGMRLSTIATRHGMTLRGADHDATCFATLSGLTNNSDGVAITYLSSRRFAASLPQDMDLAVITRRDLLDVLGGRHVALVVDGNPHDWFYTALTAAIRDGDFERLKSFASPTRARSSHCDDRRQRPSRGGRRRRLLSDRAGKHVDEIGEGVVIKPHATVGADGFENASRPWTPDSRTGMLAASG